jgi:hypothetical protein
MPVERHEITSREQWLQWRRADVTASTIGCLLGVHEYITTYELFALKTGLLDEDPEESAPMLRGRLLEPVAVELIREQNPTWNVAPARAYYRDPAARLGASPDVLANDPERGLGVIQIKCPEPSVFRKKWRDEDGQVQPPLWIACQALCEAHLVGARWAAVAAMTVGFGIDLHMVPVPIHLGVIERIRAEVARFWQRVADDEPPPPDFARDGEIIADLYREDNGREVDLSHDPRMPELLAIRAEAKVRIKADEAKVAEIEAEIVAKLGPHERAFVPGWRLGRPTVTRAGDFMRPATTFRQLRISQIR